MTDEQKLGLQKTGDGQLAIEKDQMLGRWQWFVQTHFVPGLHLVVVRIAVAAQLESIEGKTIVLQLQPFVVVL